MTRRPASPGHAHRSAAVRLALVLLAAAPGAARATMPAGDLVPVTLNVGFTPTAFLQSNRNDVEAAFKVLGETIGRERGYLVAVKTWFFQEASELFAAVDAGQVNFAVVDSLSYLSAGERSDFTPLFMTARDGQAGRRFYLLVRRDRGLRSVGDLRGRSYVELQAPELSLGRTWVLSLLLGSGAGSCEEFFGTIELVARPSAAVLPVYFGRQDACLVDASAYRLMVELNPQVGQALHPLAESELLVSAIVCVSTSSWPETGFRPALIRALHELHLEPAGRQMLALFKIEQLIPFDEAQLASARRLLAYCATKRREAAP